MPRTPFNPLHSHSQSITGWTLCFVSVAFLVLKLSSGAWLNNQSHGRKYSTPHPPPHTGLPSPFYCSPAPFSTPTGPAPSSMAVLAVRQWLSQAVALPLPHECIGLGWVLPLPQHRSDIIQEGPVFLTSEFSSVVQWCRNLQGLPPHQKEASSCLSPELYRTAPSGIFAMTTPPRSWLPKSSLLVDLLEFCGDTGLCMLFAYAANIRNSAWKSSKTAWATILIKL